MSIETPNAKTGAIRISWDMPGYGKGHGEWFPLEERDRLLIWVTDMNKQYGAGTHWLETRA